MRLLPRNLRTTPEVASPAASTGLDRSAMRCAPLLSSSRHCWINWPNPSVDPPRFPTEDPLCDPDRAPMLVLGGSKFN